MEGDVFRDGSHEGWHRMLSWTTQESGVLGFGPFMLQMSFGLFLVPDEEGWIPWV